MVTYYPQCGHPPSSGQSSTILRMVTHHPQDIHHHTKTCHLISPGWDLPHKIKTRWQLLFCLVQTKAEASDQSWSLNALYETTNQFFGFNRFLKPKIFWTKHLLDLILFGPKIFWSKQFLDPHCYRQFFWTKIILTIIFFDQNIFLLDFFWT